MRAPSVLVVLVLVVLVEMIAVLPFEKRSFLGTQTRVHKFGMVASRDVDRHGPEMIRGTAL